MNYHLHKNGWTIMIDNFDLRTATAEDIKQVSDLAKSSTLVVFKNQSLTITDEIRIVSLFGNNVPEYPIDSEELRNEGADLVNDPTGILTRVTGALNDHGHPGTAGYVDAMEWHNNQPHRTTYDGIQRSPLVWLYGVKGTHGSRTSYTNSILGYKDLDQETKDRIKDLKSIYYACADFRGPIAGGFESDENAPLQPVVIKHTSGELGIYHSHFQLERFDGMTKEESIPLSKKLQDHLTQDKYCYHHDWDDGDVVIGDQWFGIHKRWAFEKIQERLLHRSVFGYVA
jgi:alpha-ketoglutarate-dependent taurine dioxygenase